MTSGKDGDAVASDDTPQACNVPSSEAPEAGGIPQSPALGEAQADSLSEALGRDPEKYGPGDRPRIIAALRKQRERYAQASATAKPTKEKKASTVTLQSTASAKDLDL